ncbi:MAG: ABC transporter ATP-binding protein [Geminicoccaceae bacterium]
MTARRQAAARITFQRISKSFGDLQALADVSFGIPAGRVVALLGENGAGKTTAMNVLAGLYLPDGGEVLVDDKPLKAGTPRASLDAGIGMVHQQFKLVDTLTGFENLSLALHRGRFVQPKKVDSDLERLMADLGFDLDLERPVWQMPLAFRQQLEILRVLATGASTLILDEPTSVLSPLETEKLFALLRRVSESGRSIILISHKLAEVMAAADQVIVMRGGRVVHEGDATSIDRERLASLIVGDRGIAEGRRPKATIGETVLEVSDLVVDGDQGLLAVRGISCTVKAGELVALIGVAGNGQTEFLDAIGGLRPIRSGRIETPMEDGRRSFAFIPTQQLGTGLSPGLGVVDNALLGHQRSRAFGRWISSEAASSFAARIVKRFGVKAIGSGPVSRLSGGNLQRLVLGRELHNAPQLIVASYPTRGLDVGSAAAIRDTLIGEASRGVGILFASEELDESLAIATRLLVMQGGRIIAERDPRDADLTEIGRLMTSGNT